MNICIPCLLLFYFVGLILIKSDLRHFDIAFSFRVTSGLETGLKLSRNLCLLQINAIII